MLLRDYVGSIPILTHERRWKLGQLSPGSTVTFRRISWADAQIGTEAARLWTEDVQSAISGVAVLPRAEPSFEDETKHLSPILHTDVSPAESRRPSVTFRQVNLLPCVHPKQSS